MIENTGKRVQTLVALNDRPSDPEAPDAVPLRLIGAEGGGGS